MDHKKMDVAGADDEEEMREMARKIKLLKEQVQYLERRLECSRQESALKMSSIEGHLATENNKLKAREKDLRRKLHRSRETQQHQTERIVSLTAELKQINDEMKRKTVCHDGWMQHVRLPAKDDWPAIKLDTQQNKKALRHIFEQVEREGGPPVNLDPSLFMHCVILFLWWRREATAKLLEESVSQSIVNQSSSEMEELRSLNQTLQERSKMFEDSLEDCKAERKTFEETMSTNLNQLLTDNYDLRNKVAHLEDTVSALHLDNNLLRVELNGQSVSQKANIQLQELTAELQEKLRSSESELRRTSQAKDEIEVEFRLASKRLETLEQEAQVKETACRQHTDKLASSDATKTDLQIMTTELKTKVLSLQQNLKTLEESRTTIGKERESFLDQLTKAMEELEDAKEEIRVQKYQSKQRSHEQAQCSKTIKHQDEVIRNLQRDMTNHREAQTKLLEEKEKRRSLEITSTNHDRLVKEMEERMRSEELDSATLLAELCGSHTEERSRLEEHVETLEKERSEMEDVIEELSNDKAAFQKDSQRFGQDLERVSTKLHSIINLPALRVMHAPGAAVRLPRQVTDASTATGPSTKRSSPDGGEWREATRDGQIGDLEELVDLLVAIKGTSVGRLMLDGIDGDSSVDRQDVEDAPLTLEEVGETLIGRANNEDEMTSLQHPSAMKGDAQRMVVAKLRALTLMMQARQKLRVKSDHKQESRKTIRVDDTMAEAHPERRYQGSRVLVNEPLFTKQDQQLLSSPAPSLLELSVDDRPNQSAMGEMDFMGETYRVCPADTETNPSTEGTEDEDESSLASENEDLLSTLERERERLKTELADIKEKESHVQEDLQREEAAHLLFLQKVGEYQQQCARMELEKEELLQEPHDETLNTETGRRSRLEGMFLEELEGLRRESEMLVNESIHQKILNSESLEASLQELETRMPSPRLLETESSWQHERDNLLRELQTSNEADVVNPSRQQREQIPISHQINLQRDPHKSKESRPISKNSPGESDLRHAKQRQVRGKDTKGQRSPSQYPEYKALTYPQQRGKARRREAAQEAKATDQQVLSRSSDFTGMKPSEKANIVPSGSLRSYSNPNHAHRFWQQNDGPLPEFEAPLRQGRVCRDAMSIPSSLSLSLTDRVGQQADSSSADQLNNHDIMTVSLFSEPGDKPEADQGQENYILEEEEQFGDQIQHNTDDNHQAKMSERGPAGRTVHQTSWSLEHEPTDASTADNDEDKTQESQRCVGEMGTIGDNSWEDAEALGNFGDLGSHSVDASDVGRPSTSDFGKTFTVSGMPQTIDYIEESNDNLSSLKTKQDHLSENNDPDHLHNALMESQASLRKLHKERRDLQYHLTAALQTNVRLQKVVDDLRDKTGFLQASQDERANLVEAFREENDSLKLSCAAAKDDRQRLQVDLKRISKSNRDLEQQLLKSMEQVEELKRGRIDMPSSLPTKENRLDTLVERRKFRQREEELKKQLQEQIDKTYDLETLLDDSQVSVQELERERNILQDDFTTALQQRSHMRTQLNKLKEHCQLLTTKLEDSQSRVTSLKQELEEYLEQDTEVRDKEVGLLKRKLREFRVERQRLIGEIAEARHRVDNSETICRMHSQRQKKDEAEQMKLEDEVERLRMELPENKRRMENKLTGNSRNGETLKELKKENSKLSSQLRLASESLKTTKQDCWRLQGSLKDALLREKELTHTVRQVQEQLKMEVDMQAELAKRSEDQEKEISKLRIAMGRQPVSEEDTSTRMDQETNTKPRLHEMLTDHIHENKDHTDQIHNNKTQHQNETDDRKKIKEFHHDLSSLEAQRSVDIITVQSLTDDNRRLRAMVYNLRERRANDQMSHHRNSRMDAVHRALARAHVQVIATSMANNSQVFLSGADKFRNAMPTGHAARRLGGRHHLGSVGNSLEDSF